MTTRSIDLLILVLVALLLAIGVGTLLNPLERGLKAAYFQTPDWSGVPLLTITERAIGLDGLSRRFPVITRNYSLRWGGYLYISQPGTYQFTTISDDGSEVWIDGQIVVDNRGLHGLQERTGEVHLETGFHPMSVQYMQGGGLAVFRAYWTPPGKAREPFSNAPLFVRDVSPKRWIAGRMIEGVILLSKILAGVCVVSGILRFARSHAPRGNAKSGRSASRAAERPIAHSDAERRNEDIAYESGLQPASALSLDIDVKACLLIFLIVAITHGFLSTITNAYDSLWSIHTTLSLLREGDLTLDEYREIVEIHKGFGAEQVNGHLYSWYPPGPALLAIPQVFLLDYFLQTTLNIDLYKQIKYDTPGGIPKGIERWIASTIVALTAVMLYLISRLRLRKQTEALLVVVIFAFCTSAWSVASRGLWQHGPSMLVLSLTLYLLLLARQKPDNESWCIRLAGMLLAFSFLVRPTNSLSIVILTLYIVIRHRKHLPAYLLWSLSVAVPFVLVNLSVYHTILPNYYTSSGQMELFSPRFAEALLGTLFSPSRGLLIYSPVLLFALYGVALKLKRRDPNLLDYALCGILLLHWIVSSAHPRWWGGHSYGPRYFTDMLPYLLYFLAPFLAHLSQQCGVKRVLSIAVLAICMMISGFIHYRGATTEDVYGWNAYPVSVDVQPSRIWDLRDIQFLRGLTMPD